MDCVRAPAAGSCAAHNAGQCVPRTRWVLRKWLPHYTPPNNRSWPELIGLASAQARIPRRLPVHVKLLLPAQSPAQRHHKDTHDKCKQNTCLPARLQLMSDKLKDGGCGAPYNLEVGQAEACLSVLLEPLYALTPDALQHAPDAATPAGALAAPAAAATAVMAATAAVAATAAAATTAATNTCCCCVRFACRCCTTCRTLRSGL